MLKDVKANFGDRVALFGGLDPIYIFDMGSTDAVRESTRQAIADAGQGGGYILGLGEGVAPETSFESLLAMSQAARDHRVYDRDL